MSSFHTVSEITFVDDKPIEKSIKKHLKNKKTKYNLHEGNTFV